MKKKFIKVALFGALMLVAGASFVGCKDYDGDITELRDSIDKQKTELSGKVAAVETSITSLQAAQTSLTAEIAKAKDEATKAALAAQEKAIATAKAELEKVNTDLKKAIATNSEDVAALKTQTAAINDAMSLALGRIQVLEAFQTTTVEALEALVAADVTLSSSIDTINTKLADLGRRMTAVEAQIAALEGFRATDNTVNQAAIDALIVKLTKIQEDLTNLEESQLTDAMIELIAQEITAQTDAKLAVIEAAIFKGVTHVSLVTQTESEVKSNFDLLSAEAVRTWDFGKGFEGAIKFEKGIRTTFTETIKIRVSPTNAILNPANINLINSEGKDMAGLVKITDIKPFKGLLSRGISANGLWDVTIVMDEEYDVDAFKAATVVKEGDNTKSILYAVSVNTNLDSKEPRTVVSEYNITFASAEKAAESSLEFKVDDQPIANLHNRAIESEEVPGVTTPKEYVWDGEAAAEPIYKDALVNVKEGDDRHLGKLILPVVANKAITIQLGTDVVKAATAFYIVLDKERASSSDDSELLAWNGYEENITGINKVYKISETKGKAEITFTKVVNDVFGFRVYAVNSNGSLIDPDGRAFYVQVGKPTIDLNIVNTTVLVPANGTLFSTVQSEKVAVSFEGITNADVSSVTEPWSSDYRNAAYPAANLDKAFTLTYLDKDGKVLTAPMDAKWNKVRAIQTNFNHAANKIIDNVPYEGTLTLRGKNERIIATLKVTATKTLPTTAPKDFAPKSNQIVGGVYTCYLVPENGFNDENSTIGSMDLKNVFNGLDDTNYEFTFADSKDKVGDDAAVKVTSADEYTVTINKKFIDNKTKHTTAIKYNYGAVKLVWDAVNNQYKNDVHTVVAYQDIQTVYACVYDKAIHSWSWKLPANTKSEVKYNVASNNLTVAMVQGTNKYNAHDFSKTLSEIITPTPTSAGKGLIYKEAHLYSDINTPITKNEYFTVAVVNGNIALTPKSSTTTPADDVVSKLVLIYTDMYGHDVEIQLPLTVKVK